MKITLPALLVSLGLTVFGIAAHAADSGRVDLNELAASMAATPKVNINFGPAMMAGFAETLRQANPELAGVLTGVTGLRVMVFEGVDSRGAEPRVRGIINDLGARGWTQAVTVEDDDTRVNLMLLEAGTSVNGLVLLLRDGADTAVFANVHGTLDPVLIGRLIASGQGMQGFDLKGLMGQFGN